MFACSAESQSLSGRDLDAVAMRRKEGCARERVLAPESICETRTRGISVGVGEER
jgi:hypothetical protein